MPVNTFGINPIWRPILANHLFQGLHTEVGIQAIPMATTSLATREDRTYESTG